MVKDFKYIIKRIIIGTGIAILIMLFKGNLAYDVHALSVNSTGGWSDSGTFTAGSNQTEYNLIHNDTRKYFINSNGYFIFNFAYVYSRTSSVNGQNVDSLSPTISVINVKGAGNLWYPCFYGSTANFTEFSGTSQVNGDIYSYSVVCPIKTDENGIGGMQVGFIGGLPHYQVTYKFGERASFIFDRNSEQLQAQTNALNGVNNNLDELNDTINDDSIDNDKTSNSINTMKGKVATNGSISQLLTLPITLYQNILNSLNGTCSTFNLGALLGTNLTMPCINLQNILGSTLYGIIDVLISGLFILSFRKKMVDIFNHMTSLNDRGNELE